MLDVNDGTDIGEQPRNMISEALFPSLLVIPRKLSKLLGHNVESENMFARGLLSIVQA